MVEESTGYLFGPLLEDAKKAKPAIIISLVMSVGYSVVFLYFMSMFAETLIKLCIVAVQLFFFTITGYSAFIFIQESKIQAEISEGWEDMDLTTQGIIQSRIDTSAKSRRAALMGFCAFGGFTFLCSCCIYMYRKRLHDAIDVTDASMDFLRATKRVIFVPIIYFTGQVVLTIVWMWIFASIMSMQTIIPLEI